MGVSGNNYELLIKAVLDDKEIKNQLKKISSQQKIQVDAKGNQSIVREVTKWQAANGQIIKQVKTIDANTQKLKSSVITTTQATGKLEGAMARVDNQSKKAHRSFVDIVKKVSTFLAATTIIGGFTTAIYAAGESVKEFDTSLTEFRKVSDLSGASLNEYTKKLGELGGTVGRTRKHFCARVYSNMHRESI